MNNKVHLLHKANTSRLREIGVSSKVQNPTQRVKQAKGTNRGICSKLKNKTTENNTY